VYLGGALSPFIAPQGQQLINASSASSGLTRILVCAPSNAAVDELMLRLLNKQCVDRLGKYFTPTFCRVQGRGSGEEEGDGCR